MFIFDVFFSNFLKMNDSLSEKQNEISEIVRRRSSVKMFRPLTKDRFDLSNIDIHVAAEMGRIDIVKNYLSEEGSDINKKNEKI